MKKILLLLGLMFLMVSCSSGGGMLSVSGARVQYFWPAAGLDTYEAIVYPAGSDNYSR